MIQSLLTLSFLLVTENITYVRPAEAQYAPIVRLETPPEHQNDPVEATSTTEAPKLGVRWNCWLYLKSKIPDLPLTKDLIPSKTVKNAQEGAIAIFTYYRGTKDEVKHYALVDEIKSGGFVADECNFVGGVCAKRFVNFKDKNLDGYLFISTPSASF